MCRETKSHHCQLNTLILSSELVLGKLDLPTSPVLGSRVRVRPMVLSLDLTTSRPLQWRVGYLARGAAGGEHSARLWPAYIAMWETQGDSPGANWSLPSSLLDPA